MTYRLYEYGAEDKFFLPDLRLIFIRIEKPLEIVEANWLINIHTDLTNISILALEQTIFVHLAP